MAPTNYGRERPTPPHVRAHDNPVPVPVVAGGGLGAAWGVPGGQGTPAKPPASPGFPPAKPIKPNADLGAIGKGGKKPSRADARRA